MVGLKELRTRLNAVKSTKKMTTAMKLVAAAKLKKAVSALEKNSPYATLIRNAAARVLLEWQKEEELHKTKHILPCVLQKVQNPKNYLLVVFSSERGLCGAYNQNVAKATIKRIRELEQAGKNVKLVCYGKKAYVILKKNYASIILHHEPSFSSGGIFYDEAVQMFKKIIDFGCHDAFDTVEIVHGYFESAGHHKMTSIQVYPLNVDQADGDVDLDHVGDAYFDYKPSKEAVLLKACDKLLINNVYRAMLYCFSEL